MANRFLQLFTRGPSVQQQLAEVKAELVEMKAAPPAIPAPVMEIVSYERASLGGSGLFTRFNPDSLVGKQGLNVYAKMRVDEQVKAVVTFVRDAILSRGWVFEFDKESPLAEGERKKRIRVVEQIVQRMPGAFVDALNVVSTGREYGYSLTEKVYAKVTIDKKEWLGLKALLGRDPETFNFYTDAKGELVRCEQWAGGERVDIDLAKFIHYVHNPEFDRYFGRSDLREAHRSWYSKNEIIKLQLLALEKLGGGMLVASIGPEANIAYGSAQYLALQTAISNARSASSLLLPAGVTSEVHFPTNAEGFDKALQYHDLGIAKALLVPQLVSGGTQVQTGSYGQSQTQLESFAWRLKADADRLAACLNDQLFRDLGDLNWGDGEYPTFCFKPLSTEGLRWLIETWSKLIAAEAVIPTEEDEARLREILEMPPREEGSKTLMEVKQELAPEPALGQTPFGGVPGEEGNDPVAAVKDALDKSAKKTREELVRQLERFGFNLRPGAKMSSPARDARLTIAAARERVDFAVIDRAQHLLAQRLAATIANSVARTVQHLLGDDANLQALTDNDPSDIANVEPSGMDVGRMKTAFQKALADAWALGRQHAGTELRRVGKKAAFMRDAKVFADLRDKAAQFFDANSFRMAGNVSDAVRALLQAELQNSVKFGRSPGQTREAIWTRLVSKGFSSREAVRTLIEGTPGDAGILQALDALELDSEEQAAHYLDTLARTNLFEAMNEARYAEFTDPALDGFVVAFRFSAIMDERTTEVCAHMHDRVYKADSEVWDTWRPPDHFNCRSVLIPITQLDVQDGLWDGEESDEPTVEPQEGFK